MGISDMGKLVSELPSKADELHHPAVHPRDDQHVKHNTVLRVCDIVKSMLLYLSRAIFQRNGPFYLSNSIAWGYA